MRNAKRLGAAVAALAMLALMAVPVFGAADATVGRFVQELARVKNLDATDARAAESALRSTGVPLPADLNLNKRLTERDVADISRAAGLRVTTSNPDAACTLDKIDRFFRSFFGGVFFDRSLGTDASRLASCCGCSFGYQFALFLPFSIKSTLFIT